MLYRPRAADHISAMAILKIARMGHPVLGRRAQEVEDPTAPAIRTLIRDMLETMEDADGAGLAAPQVHVPLRLVIFHVPVERADDEGDEKPVPLTVLMNPDFLFRASPFSSDPARGRRLAEQLSYALWDAPPDPELMAASEGRGAELESLMNGR